jgi:glycerol-1-phosphate dehydrogenase [NAD(P)+]
MNAIGSRLDLDALRAALTAAPHDCPAHDRPPDGHLSRDAAPDGDRKYDRPDGCPMQPIGLGRVLDGPGALDRLGDVLTELGDGSGPVIVLAAATPMTVRGTGLREAVEELVAGRYAAKWVALGPASGLVHADERTVAEARVAAAGARCVITVGSGTITDIGKAAAGASAALVVVQTATSVNGYADPFSVLLREGVKRTTPSRWPDALIIDPDVLSGAPAELNLAGLGDMAAMFTATADWYLAAAVRADGPPYLPGVAALVRDRGERMLGTAAGLTDDPGRLAELGTLLTLSGISMGVAGSTAPASGMEHALSHLLEMAATATGGPGNLHGTVVGVASITAAATWAHVRQRIADGALDRPARLPDPDLIADRIADAFNRLDPTGAMAGECLADYAAKLRLLASRADPLAGLRATWAERDAVLGALLIEPAALARGLRSAGLPVRFGDLRSPVDDETARWAVANCALQRRRFGVADLAMLLGAWEDDDIDAVLTAAIEAATESADAGAAEVVGAVRVGAVGVGAVGVGTVRVGATEAADDASASAARTP